LAEARKNVGLVLQALAQLKEHHDFSYVVVGDGPLRPQLEKLALELELRDRVRFTGFVGPTELRRLLSESDLFVLASSIHAGSHEGFGIAYLEANACGTPVLAARLAGAAEAVNEGISGFFVDEPTPDSIAGALGKFFRQEVRFESAQCRAFAARFTWEKVVDHAVAHYPVQK
jgi:glycosyltransferase involved in cell wall biosynthesis